MGELKFICKRGDFAKLNNWAEQLSNATKKEEFLLFQPVEKFHEIAQEERIILALNEKDELVGSIGLWDIGESWNEMGSIYVFPECRNRGYGTEIITFACKRWNGKRIMMTSKNPLAMYIAMRSGMVPVTSEADMRSVVPLTCVCGEADDVINPEVCPFRNKKCVFFISEKTTQKIEYILRDDEIVQNARNFNFQ